MLSLVPQNQTACSELDSPEEHNINSGVILDLLSLLKKDPGERSRYSD
jgi:hypothetical protein